MAYGWCTVDYRFSFPESIRLDGAIGAGDRVGDVRRIQATTVGDDYRFTIEIGEN